MSELERILVNRLVDSIKEIGVLNSQLETSIKWKRQDESDISGLKNQVELLGGKLIKANEQLEAEHAFAHETLRSEGSLKVELTRLAEQHRNTVDALRTLVLDLESHILRPNEKVRGALKSANSHLKLIEPI